MFKIKAQPTKLSPTAYFKVRDLTSYCKLIFISQSLNALLKDTGCYVLNKSLGFFALNFAVKGDKEI